MDRESSAVAGGGRHGVDAARRAIETLGAGFLAEPENSELRESIGRAPSGARDYCDQLIRLVVRLLLIERAEARGLLPGARASARCRDEYRRRFAVARVRERVAAPGGALWAGLVELMTRLERGEARWSMPPLRSELWTARACGWLCASRCANELLRAGFTPLSPPDAARGLGAVGDMFEALLEFHPRVDLERARFELVRRPGHARKTSGSYYTPTSLVERVLDTALEPALDEACASVEPEKALLELRVCDPACGAGAFLIAAARRIARRLAVVRGGAREDGDGDEYRAALSAVVSRCVYGVDINPIAAELCRAGLWLEAADAEVTLASLARRVRCGNALIGAAPGSLRSGVPRDAFSSLPGDDPEVARRVHRRHRRELRARADGAPTMDVPCAAPEDVFLDIWCAAFFWPKRPGALEALAPTAARWRGMLVDGAAIEPALRVEARALARRHRFLHWHSQFAEVFAGGAGGFDVVLMNPPYERMKLQEREFFAAEAPSIASERTASERGRRIRALAREDPQLYARYQESLRASLGTRRFVSRSGRFPLCARGDMNAYALFAELAQRLIHPRGRVGCVLPSGLITEKTTRAFFHELMAGSRLASFYEFENVGFFSAGHGHMLRFALVTIRGEELPPAPTRVMFRGRAVEEVEDDGRVWTLDRAALTLVNPNTATCPVHLSSRDAALTRAVYRRVPVLRRDASGDRAGEDPWGARLSTMFHMTHDSWRFATRAQLEERGARRHGSRFVIDGERWAPLYEAKLVHHYNHRHGDFSMVSGARRHRLPRVETAALEDPERVIDSYYWVREDGEDGVEARLDAARWCLGWRGVTDARASARTLIASVFPRAGAGNSLPSLSLPATSRRFASCLIASLSSFALDYIARQKIAGVNLNFMHMKQLPVPAPASFAAPAPWQPGRSLLEFIRPRVLELVYTAWDVEGFARDCGYAGPPFRWDEARRFLLRCELDAALLHVYGFSREDAAYILASFPVVRRRERARFGEPRTERTILDLYERMGGAAADCVAFQSALDPGPGDRRAAHLGARRPDWAQPP